MTTTTDERKRGRWLAGWLILMAFLYAWVAYDAAATGRAFAQSPDSPVMQPWSQTLLIVLPILNIGGVIALWFWRKAGFYLFMIASIPLAILNLLSGMQFLDALFPLYFLSTLWLLLKPRWQYFY